jgi:hypothetical protein
MKRKQEVLHFTMDKQAIIAPKGMIGLHKFYKARSGVMKGIRSLSYSELKELEKGMREIKRGRK